MNCPHDLSERETACVDGLCPLCLAAQVRAMREHIIPCTPDEAGRGGEVSEPFFTGNRMITAYAMAKSESEALKQYLKRVLAELRYRADKIERLLNSNPTEHTDMWYDAILKNEEEERKPPARPDAQEVL